MLKEYPRLYTLDSKNKIRVFDIKIHCGLVSDSAGTVLESVEHDGNCIITSTGLLNGKLIEQKEFVRVGKQKRTVDEQTILQAEALYKSKLDEGYKSEDVLRMPHNTHLTHITTIIKDATLGKPNWWYSNANWDELPMLAHKFKDVKKPNYPYFIQPKLNGVRCLVKVEIITGVIKFKLISRGGGYYTLPHLENQLISLIRRIMEVSPGFTNFIFDGELYKHGIPLQEISGAARKAEEGLFASNDWLEYHIYDIINLNCIDDTQTERFRDFTSIATICSEPNIKFVDSRLSHNQKEVDEYYEQFISKGYEGAILRQPDMEYYFNQRSKALLKVKMFQDAEFKIIGCEIDYTKTIGESFVFTLKNDKNDKIFKARPTGTEEMKENWYNNIADFRGKKATVKFFERTVDGLPSHAHVMHKDTVCLIEHIRPDGE